MYIAIGLICSVVFATFLSQENKRRDRGERDEIIEGVENNRADERNGKYASVEDAQLDKGDEWSGFRYTM
jgi:hypothetical protein